jgi:NADPH:quinone reductase-like Zn-dependent oxidoreductase
VFLTAWRMLVTRARIKPGEDVLVHAAGSGVGSAAIQIARLFGARVIATAGSDEKLAKARELGASETINYKTQSFVEEVRRLTNKKGVEVVFEHTGAETWEGSIMSLARSGRLVTCGATTGYEAKTDLRFVFSKNLSIIGSSMGSKAELLEMMKFFRSGQLKPVIDRVMPLEKTAEAHRLIEQRAQFGKIVLQP